MGRAKYSAKQWSAWIDQQRGSGLTIAAFCVSIGVTENSFYVWRRKLRSDRAVVSCPGKLSAESFVPLSIVESSGTSHRIEVELPCGAVIRVPGNEQLIRLTLGLLLEFGAATAGQGTKTEPAAAAISGGSSC